MLLEKFTKVIKYNKGVFGERNNYMYGRFKTNESAKMMRDMCTLEGEDTRNWKIIKEHNGWYCQTNWPVPKKLNEQKRIEKLNQQLTESFQLFEAKEKKRKHAFVVKTLKENAMSVRRDKDENNKPVIMGYFQSRTKLKEARNKIVKELGPEVTMINTDLNLMIYEGTI